MRGLALTERARRYHSRPGMNGDCDYVTLWRLATTWQEQGRGSSPVAQPMIVAPPLWRPSAPLAIAVFQARRSGGIHPWHGDRLALAAPH